MKYSILIIILIFSALQTFAQKRSTIVLKDSTILKGKIIRYDNHEIKFLTKNNRITTIHRDSILSPKEITLKTSNVHTIIGTQDNKKFRSGKIIKETETFIIISLSFESEKIDKSTIVYQAFYVKKYYEETETFIRTKDGNLFVGDVLRKQHNKTIIDIGNGIPQEIDNELIIESADKRKATQKTGRILGYMIATFGSLIVLLTS